MMKLKVDLGSLLSHEDGGRRGILLRGTYLESSRTLQCVWAQKGCTPVVYR